MEALGGLFLRVLAISAGCSAVVGPLLLLAPRMRKRVAARSFYVLFLLLALRLMLPVEVKLPAPVVRLQVPETVTVTVAAPAPAAPVQTPVVSSPAVGTQAVPMPAVRPQTAQSAPAARSIPLLYIAGLVWAAGAAASALWAAGSFLLARRRLLRTARSAGAEEAALLDALRRELGVRRPVRLYRSGDTTTPLALGLLRPAVVLPEDGCTAAALPLVLRHELTHIRRWDVAYKLVLSLACAVNWFNPLVWLMDRAAGRNLELCCDDDVARGLGEAGRKEYGRVLLAAAGAARPLPFTTSFSGGKEQMAVRLLNLFTEKKNSAALVCLVLAAALLAGGLVACESAGAGSTPKLTAENRARRARLEEYFNASCAADSASVVLADLTGDGLDEMIVLTMAPESEDPPSLREGMTEDRFTYGDILCFGVGEDGVLQYPGSLRVSSSHAGWGYVYLVPRTDGDGFALLDFHPYFGQGSGSYIYSLYAVDEEAGLVELEGDEVMFLVDQSSLMEDTTEHASREEAQALLNKMQAYRDSGVPLLVYNEGYDSSTGGPEFAYLNAPPADAFAADAATDLAALREQVVSGGTAVQLPLPEGELSTPEEALDRLELTLYTDPDQVAFRLPNYTGDWNIQIAGRMRMGGEDSADFISVHYLEDAEWTPGKRYGVETEGAYFSELILTASVIGPDGTQAQCTIFLAEDGQIIWKRPANIPAPPESVAAAYLETMARRMYLFEEVDGLEFTAFYGRGGQLKGQASHVPYREYTLPFEDITLTQEEVMDRLIFVKDSANYWKYRNMLQGERFEDVQISHQVWHVDTEGDQALVDITQELSYRRAGAETVEQRRIDYVLNMVRLDGEWLVLTVGCSSDSELEGSAWFGGDEESYCRLTGMPHSARWFNRWFGSSAGQEALLRQVTDSDKLPCDCLAGWPLENGDLELVYALVGETGQMTVRLLDDDSVEILSVQPWEA